MKKHEIFPIEIFTFERPDLVDPILDALDPIERGMFNFPHPVQSTKGNLQNLPAFRPLTTWIEECLEEIKKDQEFEMWGRFEISMMWGNVSMPHSEGMHQPHRHPLSYWSGIFNLTEGHPTQFQDPCWVRSFNQMEVVSSAYKNACSAPEWRPGTLVVWPSWLIHFSTPHVGDKFRANIAWNALPTGPINFGPFGQNMTNIKLVQDDPVMQPNPDES